MRFVSVNIMEFEGLRLWFSQTNGQMSATARAKSGMVMPDPPLTRVRVSVIGEVLNE
jgi:hypothetical protein